MIFLRTGKKQEKRGLKGPGPTSFKPGQSGNPGGRPKLTDHVREARRLCEEFSAEAMLMLMEITRDLPKDSSLKCQNLQYLINQAAGAPRQRQEITGEDGKSLIPEPVKEASTDELLAVLAAVRGQ